jgi:transposase InsO family protein
MKKEILDTLERLKKKTGLPIKKISEFLSVGAAKISVWKKKRIKKEKSNIPKSHWSTPEEQEAVTAFKKENMCTGYVRLTWMMIDRNIAFLSPSSVYRILVNAALNNKWTKPAGEPKKIGFDQPEKLHEHWHTDISYVNFRGTFVYLISVLDGFSRAILGWDIRTRMESFDVQIVLWGVCTRWLDLNGPDRPRLITDNGSQFSTKEFKETLKHFSIKNVRTSVNHPQSNGKLERFHGTIKSEVIRDMPKFTLEQMKKEIEEWIHYYNHERLHSSLDYVAPMDVIGGRKDSILLERKRKLLEGKQKRKEYSLQSKTIFEIRSTVMA